MPVAAVTPATPCARNTGYLQMKPSIFTIIKIAVSIALFYLIFRNIDFNSFGEVMQSARLGMLALAYLVLWAGHFVCVFRWRMLLRPLMPVRSLKSLFGIYCIGLFFNLTFPTVVGGDVVKIFYVGKQSNSYSQSFAATFLDRDAGMLAMMILACAGILFNHVTVPGIAVEIIVWAATAAFVLGNICLFTPRFRRAATRLLRRLRMLKIADKLDRVSSVLHVIGSRKSLLTASLLISFANQVLAISAVWITALALNLDIPLSYFLIFVPVITLISMIPVSLNGMGLREYAFLSLFSAVGIPAESCIALGLLSSILIILSSLPGGIIYIFFKNKANENRFSSIETELS